MIDRTFLHDLVNQITIAMGMLQNSVREVSKPEGVDHAKVKDRCEKALNAIQKMHDAVNEKRAELKAKEAQGNGVPPVQG